MADFPCHRRSFLGYQYDPDTLYRLFPDERRSRIQAVLRRHSANRYFEVTLYLLHKLNVQVGNFLRGQFIDATIVGLLAMFALWLVGIKYFFLIGLFTGLANLIPYFGPLAGAGLAIVLSILQTGGFEMSLYVILAFTVIKLLDDAFIQPLVVAKSVDMNPLTVLLVILIGGKLFGILGMLLSVPIAGLIKVVVRESIMNYRKYRTV